MKRGLFLPAIALVVLISAVFSFSSRTLAVTQQTSGSVGIEGTISSNPPSQGATITLPTSGQSFTTLPVTVAGLCPKGLLVEIFKNGVFGGSVQCSTGSFSIPIDLFEARNDLVARVYDALNQPGPDSNTVSVTFNGGGGSGPRITLISSFAKRGSTPGTPLSWPLTLSGGRAPYALSVDWGDKSTPDLLSQAGPGDFTIQHTYLQSGVFNVVIKATDANGASAFLQVVGIGNGPIQQTTPQSNNQTVKVERVIIWWPFLVTLVLTAAAFWLGQKHQLELIRDRLRRGERPFK
jgi:hypothetical protein